MKEKLKKKLAALRALFEAAEKDQRDLTEDERKQADALEDEIASLEKSVAACERLAEREKAAAETEVDEGKPEIKTPFPPVIMERQAEQLDDGGFKDVGDFVHAIRFAPGDGRLKSLHRQIGRNGKAGEATDPYSTPDFGFMMPPKLLTSIRELQLAGESIVRPRATVFPAGDIQPDAGVTIPMMDQYSEDSNMFGGVEVAWIDEGGFKPETTLKLTSTTITPHELAASFRVTDKALRNFPALSPLLSRNLFAAMAYAEDIAFLWGTGDEASETPKQPAGVLTTDAVMEVPRENADFFTYADAVNILAKSFGNDMIWLLDTSLKVDVYTMQDPSGRYVFGAGDVSLGRPETLLGRPIHWTDRTASGGAPALTGSVLLADFRYYGIKDGFGPVLAASPHPFFQNNVTVIKVFNNVGGKPLISGPIKQRNGMEVSPFVALGPVEV